MPSFSIVRGPVGAPKPKPQPKKLELVGRSVLLSANPTAGRLSEIVGVVKARDGYQLTIALGIPNSDGVLVTSKDASLVVGMDEVTELDAVTMLNGDVREWKTQSPIQGVKAASSIRDADNRVIDYKDVSFEGYGSTFQSTTPADREGDYILPTAFDKSLRRFRQNPVMLVDHQRRVSHLMGHYSSVSVNERGLALRGEVTNSTHWDARHVRFSIMEESLKTWRITTGSRRSTCTSVLWWSSRPTRTRTLSSGVWRRTRRLKPWLSTWSETVVSYVSKQLDAL